MNPASTASGAASTQLPASIPFKRDDEGSLASAYIGWIVVLAVAWVGIWLLKRARGGKLAWPGRPGGDAADAARLLSTTRLTPQASLHVVEWQGRRYLLSQGAQGLQMIDSRESGGSAAP